MIHPSIQQSVHLHILCRPRYISVFRVQFNGIRCNAVQPNDRHARHAVGWFAGRYARPMVGDLHALGGDCAFVLNITFNRPVERMCWLVGQTEELTG